MSAVELQYLEDADTRAAFDGSEQRLEALFERPESELGAEIEAILARAPDWLTQYHLSPQRRLLLSWYPFAPGSTIVEVGAGCGALTGLLCRRARRVIANEKFASRARVIARRLADQPQLGVLVGGVEHVRLDEPADYVTCIGVWEYAGRFMPAAGDDAFTAPFERFLAVLRGLVRPGGRLLLAIENRLGLAYLAGAAEDHVDRPLVSVEDYPGYDGVRTFARGEIVRLLAGAGFAETRFYLPFPDYKLPHLVVREDAVEPLRLTAGALGALVPGHRPRLPLANEQLLAAGLLAEGLLPQFANSFLVEAW